MANGLGDNLNAARAAKKYYAEHPEKRPPKKKKPRHRIKAKPKNEDPKGHYTARPAITVELPDHLKPDPPSRIRDMERRLFSPTPSQRVLVAGLSAFGVPREGISAYIKVSESTLESYFRYELAEGRPRTEAALVAIMLVKALSGNISAVSMLLKCGFGWTESAKSNGPTTLEALTVDQRLQLIESIRASVAPETTRSARSRKDKAGLDPAAGPTDGGN